MCNWRGRGIKNLFFAPQSVIKFSLSGLFKATTDLYGNCTLRHSGTSAAAPEAAGVFALALEAKYVPPCSCNEPYYLYQCKHNCVRIRRTHQLSSCHWTMDAFNCALYSELQFQAFAAYQCHWLPLSMCILISFIIFSHSVERLNILPLFFQNCSFITTTRGTRNERREEQVLWNLYRFY